MCGIAAIIYGKEQTGPDKESTLLKLAKMSDRLKHRGPDDQGVWLNVSGTAGFSHRRLAVIDLSQSAAQPMHYLERYTLLFNGAIYNYIELREILMQQGYRFRTHCDSEVILAAYAHFKSDCVKYLDGMFAFSVWDEQEQTLFMARDRFGEKPLYYAFIEECFYFASERKAIWACGIEKKVNSPLLLNYIVLGYTQTALDKTITYYQDVFALPPAHYLLYERKDHAFSIHSYWDIDKETVEAIASSEAIEKFNALLERSVEYRLRCDVPLGSSISGGIDSAAVAVAIGRKQAADQARLHTFSAVFPGFEKDESYFIDLLSGAIDCENHKVIPRAEGLLKDLDDLCYYQEEPFISSSVYAQYCIYRLAKENGIKVLLDGQGADEILAGYFKYLPWFLQELLRKKPFAVSGEIRALKKNGIRFSWGPKNYAAAVFPAQASLQLEKREARKMLSHPDLDPGFREAFFDPHTLYKPLGLTLNDQLYFNTCQSGLEDLLRYADRNSMAHGRELRLPFLSHELVSFVFSLPSQLKIHNGWTKWLLRKSQDGNMPSEICWRKDKVGYEPPQKQWMQHPAFQERIQSARQKLIREGILRASVLSKKIQPQEAIAAENEDWRYLIAATCMEQKS